MSEGFDDIVVGAGSAGAVIAARLSEDDGRRVLLEAGPDFPDVASTPPTLLNPNFPVIDGFNRHIAAMLREKAGVQALRAAAGTFVQAPGMDRWRLARTAATGGKGAALTIFDYPVGQVVGGSSSINGALVMRGVPEDYDEWAEHSEGLWNWHQVAEVFWAIEADHGGPVPIFREPRSALFPLQESFLRACLDQGHPWSPDLNEPVGSGVGIAPKMVLQGRRMSTALTYLAPARGRAGLTILPGAMAARLTWAGPARCGGVEAIVDGRSRHFAGDRVILCGGALQTPPLLMRSGIGAPALLRSLGIEARLPLGGVGRNLSDHPAVVIWGVPGADAGPVGQPAHQAVLTCRSSQAIRRVDSHVYMMGVVDCDRLPPLRTAIGSPVAAGVSASLVKPLSRGQVTLTSADPGAMPRVVVNCLARAEDIARLKTAVRTAWGLLQSPPLADRFERIPIWTPGLVESDAALERAIVTFARPTWHAVGTARIGRLDDPEAVVDPRGRVHGTDNLWVADASVMPTVPAAPTNLTCIMIAERIAGWLRSGC